MSSFEGVVGVVAESSIEVVVIAALARAIADAVAVERRTRR